MSELQITIENVGGIDRLETAFDDGVSLITGENASNKTSLLEGILFAFGADHVPIRTDTEEARVKLTYRGRTVERTAVRRGTGVAVSGDSWIDDDGKLLFDRFAGLLETNPLRTAVQTNADVETLLKEPMDIDRLERERSRNVERKRDLQGRIDAMDDVDDELASKRAELKRRREDVEELADRLEALYDEEPDDDELEGLRERRAELVSERGRLEDQVADLEDAVDRIDDRIDDLETELADARETTASFELPELRAERTRLGETVDEIDERIEVLQSVLTANREMLNADVRGVLDYETELVEDSVECWACGRRAPASAFEETTDRLADLVNREKEKRRETEPEIREIEERIDRAEDANRDVERLEGELQSAESKRESRQESIAEKREQLTEVGERLATVEDEIAAAREERATNQSEVTAEIEETRVSLEAERREVERLERAVESLEEQQRERVDLRAEVETLTEEIRSVTCRIENMESHLRDSFNEAMDDLVEVLAFDRVERMWLDGEFDLVVAREVDGNVREDSPANLAESERETIGLVLGLAGYLAYNVDEVAPVLVLDSLGAFDAERTRRLVDYFGNHADLLLAAVHPEQTADLLEDYQIFAPSPPA